MNLMIVNPGQTVQVRYDHRRQVHIVSNDNVITNNGNGNDMNGNDMNVNEVMNRNRAAHQRSGRRQRIHFTRQQDIFFRRIIDTFSFLSVPRMRDIVLAILNGSGNNYLEQIRRRFPDTEVPTVLRERMDHIYGYIYNRCIR